MSYSTKRMVLTRKCIACGEKRPTVDFRRMTKAGKPYYVKQCSVCRPPTGSLPDYDAEVAYRRRNAWRRRIVMLKHRYGITPEQLDKMVLRSEGRCGICGEPSCDLKIDHNHRTGAVRGLLCHRCNIGLGIVDEPDWLSNAMAYLAQEEIIMPPFQKFGTGDGQVIGEDKQPEEQPYRFEDPDDNGVPQTIDVKREDGTWKSESDQK